VDLTRIYELRDEANRLIDIADPEHLYGHYRAKIAKAYRKRDYDRLEIIIWYFSVYWASVNGEPETSLITVDEESSSLRSLRGYGKVARFVTVEALNEIDRFSKAVRLQGHLLKQSKELTNEIFVRPEAGRVMEHLICERGIYDWVEIKPMLEELLEAETQPLTNGML
jgi:hypothetical protein